jgi:hypothetical protein
MRTTDGSRNRVGGVSRRYRSCMTAQTHHPGDNQAQTAFVTLLPMRLDQGMTVTHFVNVPSPWGSPLLMGATGTDPRGEPILVLVNEAPVNFLRPVQALDEPDKWQLELLHLQRASVDARLGTGSDLFHGIEKGGDPPDAIVHIDDQRFGWELTTFSIESRRLAHDLFIRVRAKAAFQQRHRVGHLTGHIVYMWFGMERQGTGLPYRRNDDAAVDQLVEALVNYQPDPTHYTVEAQGGPPAQLPAGFDAVDAPGDVAFFCTPFINAVPTSPLFSLTGLEIGLAYQSVHLAHAEWAKLRAAVHRKDRPGNNVLLISAGAPDRFGNQYPAEEVLASFLLDHPESIESDHLSAVILHFWSSGRAVNLLAKAPQEAWAPVYQGISPAFQPFRAPVAGLADDTSVDQESPTEPGRSVIA